MKFKEIARFCGGKYSGNITNVVVNGIATDSRGDVNGKAFVALVGENFDGHNYVAAAIEKGAKCAIVSDRKGFEEGRYGRRAILVDDTLKALADIAEGYLKEYLPDMRRIAVTGSVGKTTTKELVHAVLASEFKAEKTPLSHNNEVGLPMTALSLDPGTEIFVAEMGMRGFGQISYLEKIVRPEAAVITTIGNAHLELLGSRENILKAKMEVTLGGARLPKDKPFKLIVNGDNDLLRDTENLRKIAAGYGCENLDVITFGLGPTSTFRAAETVCGEDGVNYLLICPEGNVKVSLPIPGEHNIYNSLAAIAAGSIFGISASEAVEAIVNYAAHSGGDRSIRQRTVKLLDGRITLIDDAYNAGPESMPASLKVLHGIKADVHVAALADMVELGPRSPEFHREVGRTAAKYCDKLFTVGEKALDYAKAFNETAAETTAGAPVAKPAAESLAAAEFDAVFAALQAYIDPTLETGKTVAILVKGSHIMEMGHISKLIEGAYK